MTRLTRYNKRIRVTYITSAVISMILMAVAFPWFGAPDKDTSLYIVELNGVKVGTCEDIEDANVAYLSARTSLESDSKEAVYIEGELVFYEQDAIIGKPDNADTLTDNIYQVLRESTVETKQQAYVVDIDGLTITLSSADEVTQLLEAAKAKYDEEDEFDTVLFNDESSRFSSISYDIISADTLARHTDNVMLAVDGQAQIEKSVPENAFSEPDHIVSIDFAEDINITETYVPSTHIMKLEDAVELVTKETEANKTYEVVAGDTLSGIAATYGLTLEKLLAMNPDYSEETYIRIGDLINVTVPEPELSVIVTKQKSYEEYFDLPVEYIKNDSMYTTYSNVINEGISGHRAVIANIQYTNGTQTNIEILEQKVTQEAVARVVEVGTLTPPTYIRPVSAGYISSNYGFRWGRLHGGIDYACCTGTSVMASSSGYIVEAGWNGSYGYTVLINHPDGKQTRYAHLSRLYVSCGQSISQGEVIGLSGNTGNSTGPHLHFEIIVGGSRVNPLNYLY